MVRRNFEDAIGCALDLFRSLQRAVSRQLPSEPNDALRTPHAASVGTAKSFTIVDYDRH
jgi:hypothetical protein